MDSPAVNRLFRQFASHRFCKRYSDPIVSATALASYGQPRPQWQSARSLSHSSQLQASRRRIRRELATVESDWQQRTDFFPEDRSEEFRKFPLFTAEDLRYRKNRPRRIKMLMRDFIEDSLYNPNYGYFSKNVTIFNPGEPFEFNKLRDELEFHKLLGQRYTEFEDKLDGENYNDARQLWHTPTELFSPYYGEAVARYMVANYKLSLYPYHDLTIYEIGAGNGTLMMNILDYIRRSDYSVYERTKFKIIEVSSSLAALQTRKLLNEVASQGHRDKVEIINASIFDWDTYVPSPCFFLAFEVIDNFAHDVVRYDPFTEQALQGQVLIDQDGDFYEFYTPEIDPVAARFLRVRDAACESRVYPHPLRAPRWYRHFRHNLPFAPNLTLPEYLPTRLMHFFDVLNKYFPAHRLITGDFHSLPNAIKGYNSPVVQTRYKRRTVLVQTPLVQQGYFDILFPTDFGMMEDIYRALTGRLTRTMTHEEWLARWADVECCEMKSGENALFGWYKNASVMITV